MKILTPALSLLATLALGATLASAQPAPKVIVVDMAKVYDTHFKTEEANAKFNEAGQRAQEQLDELNKQIQAVAKEYEELVEQTKNTVLNQGARDKAAADAQRKMQEFQQRQAEAQNFRANTQRSLQTRAKNHRDLIMDEIMKVVNDLAKTKGATLVFDKTGPSAYGVPVLLYSDAAYDITDEVVKIVNKDRPAAPATPAPGTATPTPAPTPAPAAPESFTVPNVTPGAAPKKP